MNILGFINGSGFCVLVGELLASQKALSSMTLVGLVCFAGLLVG
jgi:hypothetical protein